MHNVVIRRFLGRSRLAESLVEDVFAEHKNAMFARDVEELIAECLELEKISRSAWDYVLDVLFSERANETDELGNMMKMAIAKVSVVFNRVNQLIDEMKARGHGPKEVADFLIARREIQRINEDVAKKFPPINEEMVKRSLEAFRRGEGRTAEEMLHESQGHGSS